MKVIGDGTENRGRYNPAVVSIFSGALDDHCDGKGRFLGREVPGKGGAVALISSAWHRGTRCAGLAGDPVRAVVEDIFRSAMPPGSQTLSIMD